MASKNIEFTSNFDSFDSIIEFKKELRKQVIENGLDSSITLSTKELKTELQYIINKKIRMNETPGAQPGIVNTAVNGLGQSVVNIPKSEDELLKFLTNGSTDPSKYNKTRDYTSLSEAGIVFGHNSRGTAAANRVTLRMDIEPGDTVQDQYQKAAKFFSSAMIGLPSSSGEMTYFVNPGIDLSAFVKIKCSTVTGDENVRTRKGLNPPERFDRASKKGYAEWTIKQEAIDVVRKDFINITDILTLIKNGDLERASQLLTLQDKNQKLVPMKEQLDKLITKPDSNFFQDNQGRWRIKAGTYEGGRFATLEEILTYIPLSTQAYMNAVKLINNLKIVKKITDEEVVYTIMSTFSDFQAKEEVDFYTYIEKAIRAWVVGHENYWFNALVKKVEALIKKYESPP